MPNTGLAASLVFLLATTGAAGCLGPAAERSPATLTIAIQPTDNADAIMDKARDLEAFLEARVPADVEIKVPLTYVGAVEALRFGHADVALLSAWPAVLAKQKAGAEVVLAEKREVVIDGETSVAPYYYSYYVVLKDSPYQSIADLSGKTVAYPSATSTSGYVFPVAKLVTDGFVPAPIAGKEADPKAFFGSVLFAGGYSQAWEALKSGRADVAVTAGDVNAKLFGEVMAGTRVIATQGPVPSHAVVYSKDFRGTDLAEKLTAALLELKGEHKDLMRKLVSGIFVEFELTTTEKHAAALEGALAIAGLRFQEKLG